MNISLSKQHSFVVWISDVGNIPSLWNGEFLRGFRCYEMITLMIMITLK